MKFKSWHLIPVGILLQLLPFIGAMSNTSHVWGGVAIAIIGFTLLILCGISLIPMFLLIFQKTRKIGAIISIIAGIAIILTMQFGFIIAIFLITAGILALWKKYIISFTFLQNFYKIFFPTFNKKSKHNLFC
jgi:hypothetical protein